MRHKHIHNSLLEGSGNICLIVSLSLHIEIIQIIEHRRLESREGEVIFIVRNLGTREFYCMRIALIAHLINLRTSRVAQAYYSCHLVKGFPRRIIPGSAQYLVFTVILNLDQMRMST